MDLSWKANGHPLYRGNRKQDRGREWPEIAASIRKRDDYVCQACGEDTGKNALHVDHLVPFRVAKRIALTLDVDPNDPRNLLTLCVHCHAGKTPTERYLLQGSVKQFIAWAKDIVGRERLEAALELFGLLEKGSKRI